MRLLKRQSGLVQLSMKSGAVMTNSGTERCFRSWICIISVIGFGGRVMGDGRTEIPEFAGDNDL